MAAVLTSYDAPVLGPSGSYHARAVGRRADDGMWEAWIEFVPLGGVGDVLATGVESRQPEHEHLAYWASGLTAVYLEGALQRALDPITVRVRTIETPLTNAPAPRSAKPGGLRAPEAVLNPFEIGSRSFDVLRQELGALNRPRLLNIITAFDLNPASSDLSWMTDGQLVHFIVIAVETQLHQRSGGR